MGGLGGSPHFLKYTNMALNSPSYNIRMNVQETIELLIQHSFTDEDIQRSFRVIRDLYAGTKKLAIGQQMENITGKTSHCAPSYAGEAKFSERTLEVKYAEAGVRWCYDEFVNTYYDQLAPLYTTAQGNPNLNQLLNLLLGLMQTGIQLDVERVAWFGSSDSVNATGVRYDWADGIWTRIMNELMGTTDFKRVDTLSGTNITGSQAKSFLTDVYNNADPRLRQIPANQKRIHISGDMWLKILTFLEDSAISNGFIKVFNEPEAGIAGTYRGVPIVVHDRWDVVLANDFGAGKNTYLAHDGTTFGGDHQNFILYTTIDNLVVASDLRANAQGGASFFRVYQDPETDEIRIRSKFVFDTNYVFPYLMSVGV